jgi:hypothetical protein
MKSILKYTTATVLAGALALAMASPSQARHGHNAAIGGFIAGAAVGAAVANSNNGYYAEPGYAYEPGYADQDYAYEPAPAYYGSGSSYYNRSYQSGGPACNTSPASQSFGATC